jgi:UDP-glucose 4-epimerase
MADVLVTGGAGFIGSHLAQRLVEDGHRVTVFDNLATGLERNLEPIRDRIRFLRGDLRDPAAVREAVLGQELVFHHAALGSVPRSIDDPVTSNAVNVDGTLNLLVSAREAGVRRLLYSSSSSVYGSTKTLPKLESMPARPQSPYALTKFAAEEYCRVFHEVYGLETVALRYFNVFGPRQRPDSQYAAVIPRFITAVLEGRTPIVHGDGTNSRDFTFVSNNVHANVLAALAPAERVAGRVFNIACNARISLNEVLEKLAVITGRPVTPQYGPGRPGDVDHSLASTDAAEAAFGYRPLVGFDEGLRRTVEAFAAGSPARDEVAGAPAAS